MCGQTVYLIVGAWKRSGRCTALTTGRGPMATASSFPRACVRLYRYYPPTATVRRIKFFIFQKFIVRPLIATLRATRRDSSFYLSKWRKENSLKKDCDFVSRLFRINSKLVQMLQVKYTTRSNLNGIMSSRSNLEQSVEFLLPLSSLGNYSMVLFLIIIIRRWPKLVFRSLKEDSPHSSYYVAVTVTPGILDVPRGPCGTREVAGTLWPLDKAHALIRGYARSTVRKATSLPSLSFSVFFLTCNRNSRPRPTERSNPPDNLWLTF